MRIIILITILFNLFSCENKANNDFMKPYKKIIEFYNENSNYKKCTVNQEMDEIFKKKELTPIFRIENYYCYTIWLTENRDKNIFIYYTVFDHLSDIYETSKRFLIKNRTFNKVKSVNSDFFVFQTVKSEKGKYYNKNILKNGSLSIYNKKVNKVKSDKLRKLISKIDKGLYTCRAWGDSKISDNKISSMNISSHQLRFNALRLDYPFIKNKKLKEKYYNFYQNDNCIDFKLLVDYVFKLVVEDK